MTYEAGCPAKSLAGHDKGQYFIILSDEGEYVTVSNGTTRPVAGPKRKNKKHVQAEKTPIIRQFPPTDEEIRRELINYTKSRDCI